MAERNVKIIRGFKVPKKNGEHYRILCMTGQNKGLSYYITGDRLVMGRGDKVDIQVLDNKSSREHAELKFINNSYVISDLGSQNGVIVNDLKIKQHRLNNGDKIIIGQTVFKFDHIVTQHSLELVKSEGKEEEQDIDEDREPTEEEKKSKKRIYVILALMVVIYVLLDTPEKPKEKKKTVDVKTASKDSFAESLRRQQIELDQEQKEKLQTILHRGLRELREFNYARAIEEFNLALVLSPNNGRAQFYLSKAEQKLYAAVDKNLIKAKREEAALKYNAAIVSYCSVIRLLRKYPNHEHYKGAEEEINKLELKLGMKEGEINCLSNGEF